MITDAAFDILTSRNVSVKNRAAWIFHANSSNAVGSFCRNQWRSSYYYRFSMFMWIFMWSGSVWNDLDLRQNGSVYTKISISACH